MASEVPSDILFLSTYPPVKCGIASFTKDLVSAIAPQLNTLYSINICALDQKNTVGLYESPVRMVMEGKDIKSCIETAKVINNTSSIQLLCIEHEFGLYGGDMGDYLLAFLAMLEKPFIIRLHTVLPSPDHKRLNVVKSIGLLAERIIVMTVNSARLLKEDYQLNEKKIMIIPHGTHANTTLGATDLKTKYNLGNKKVLTTFGLLSPNKGIEKGILAMKAISREFPDSVYLVIGHTHPNLLLQEGEKYRDYLQQLIAENKLTENVRLVNEYVPTEKLMEYLALTDIYLFTSKDPDQAVSGTFLYAMSAGCPIISNSFVLAKEMLDEHTGIILQTNSESELAEKAIGLLQDETLRKEMGRNAFLRTRTTTWEKVAQKHVHLFYEILGKPALQQELSSFTISNQ